MENNGWVHHMKIGVKLCIFGFALGACFLGVLLVLLLVGRKGHVRLRHRATPAGMKQRCDHRAYDPSYQSKTEIDNLTLSSMLFCIFTHAGWSVFFEKDKKIAETIEIILLECGHEREIPR